MNIKNKKNIRTLEESKLTDINNDDNKNNSKNEINSNNNNKKLKIESSLQYSIFDSPIGKLCVFVNSNSIIRISLLLKDEGIENLKKGKILFLNDQNQIIKQFKNEIDQYFNGKIKEFKTPITIEYGSDFQKMIWKELCNIPYGETRSYADIAEACGLEKKFARAVASCCRLNRHLLIIPCHRVISSQGTVIGYSGRGGIDKQYLISNVEKKFK